MSANKFPILYSFRRCPYAMRARFVLRSKLQNVELREVKLQNKPEEFLKITALGTVPVLVISKSKVLLESLDIIRWCLKNSKIDLEKELEKNQNNIRWEYIKKLDTIFKYNLDRYKYPNRFSNIDPYVYREKNIVFLNKLNERLKKSKFLFDNKIDFADYCIFPFIRQFKNVDVEWFEKLNFKFLNDWFSIILESEGFESIMKKNKVWEPTDNPIITNFN